MKKVEKNLIMNRIEHREEKWIYPFVEYSCDNVDKKLPLIIQLHGVGERGDGKAEYHVDEEKVYLTGLSMGG